MEMQKSWSASGQTPAAFTEHEANQARPARSLNRMSISGFALLGEHEIYASIRGLDKSELGVAEGLFRLNLGSDARARWEPVPGARSPGWTESLARLVGSDGSSLVYLRNASSSPSGLPFCCTDKILRETICFCSGVNLSWPGRLRILPSANRTEKPAPMPAHLYLAIFSRTLVGLILLIAGAVKILDFASFSAAIRGFKIFSDAVIPAIARFVPIAECSVGVLLLAAVALPHKEDPLGVYSGDGALSIVRNCCNHQLSQGAP